MGECLDQVGVGYLSISLAIENVIRIKHGLEIILLEEVVFLLHFLQNCYHFLFHLVGATFNEFGY